MGQTSSKQTGSSIFDIFKPKHPTARLSKRTDALGEAPEGATDKTKSSLLDLPIELTEEISGYLNTRDTLTLSSTCKFLRARDRLNLGGKVHKLLLHVAHGEQDIAEIMIKENLNLLFEKGKVTRLLWPYV